MKFRFSRFTLLAAVLSLFAFQSFAKEQPMQVTVSIVPQKYFVNEIGGKYVEVNVMVPPGAEPEDYDPTPLQVTKLHESKLYFAVGVPFETTWLERFHSANPKMTIVKTQKGIEKMPMEFDDHGHHLSSTAGIKDPHIWLSPALVRIQAMNIRDALTKADPEHAQYYRENYMKFAKEINAIDEQVISITSKIPAKDNQFMTFHPAWGYFAADYGLRQFPIEQEGKEASVKRLKQLIDIAKKEHIKVVFIEPQFSKQQAKVIANEIGGKVVAINPLAEDWGQNLVSIAKAFKAAAI
ncbi:zinc ABC transporter substrate-binding protein [Vibrio sp. S4M6]|uniref:metal ABC transporter solute-binding protein, Zn/Mn family n=1 Tax=Vibrio sinus TaxID=2946865 RepID=UPI00202A237F|nr:zinc ABC transporter substrate-binding protein [Vibrio sinus]MCL9780196.1 zinc ABC transporter substrate-binding protein [Vibrio sinus]